MKNWIKLLFLPSWLLFILIIICSYGLTYIFLKGLEMHPIAFLLYPLSFYTLVVLCIFIGLRAPKVFKKCRERIDHTKFGHQYMTDVQFKTKISLSFSLGITIAYSIMKLTYGIYYQSFWWIAVAIYYIVLSLIRYSLLSYMNKEHSLIINYKRYRLCGIFMILINLSLSGIIFQMIWQDKTYSYPEIMVIAMAAYTFYALIVSIIDFTCYHKSNNPILSAAKIVRLVAAIVSILTLETAMLRAFGNNVVFNKIVITLTGTAVCICILGLSIYMIVKANKEIKKLYP